MILSNMADFTCLVHLFSRYVVYKKSTVPFLYCRLCQRVLEEASANSHECVTAIAEITTIFRDEPQRVSILEERLNVIYPYIFPLTLDGNITNYAYCRKCNTFLPKGVAVKVGAKIDAERVQG